MKQLSLQMLVANFILVVFFLMGTVSSVKGGEPPEVVTIDMLAELYEPVIFDHAMHVGMYSCGACHHHTAGDEVQRKSCRRCHAVAVSLEDVSCVGCHLKEGGNGGLQQDIYHIDKPGLQGALHLQCVGCHKEESGPVGCMECHGFTPVGRKRFGVSE
jgi:hypothetical protein